MAKTPTAVPTDEPASPGSKVTLNEFCLRASLTSRSELIGAFERVERSAGRVKDVESAFRERFDAFVNKPV